MQQQRVFFTLFASSCQSVNGLVERRHLEGDQRVAFSETLVVATRPDLDVLKPSVLQKAHNAARIYNYFWYSRIAETRWIAG